MKSNWKRVAKFYSWNEYYTEKDGNEWDVWRIAIVGGQKDVRHIGRFKFIKDAKLACEQDYEIEVANA